MTRRRRWLCAAASLAAAFAGSAQGGTSASGDTSDSAAPAEPGAAPSAPPLVPVLRPEEQLLLQVRTDKWVLDEAFTGYSTPTGTYLPLGDFYLCPASLPTWMIFFFK